MDSVVIALSAEVMRCGGEAIPGCDCCGTLLTRWLNRSWPRQRLLPQNPIKEYLIDSSPMSQACWVLKEAIIHVQRDKAFSPYLGQLMPLYPISSLVL